jgi:hypothetical protein
MDKEEILQLLSDNHRTLIITGGLICFISVFLPFISVDEMHMEGYTLEGFDMSLSTTWLFWIYMIVIAGMYYGYFQNYGEKYPFLFLATGGLLVLMTLYGTQIYSLKGSGAGLLYGFFLELIGSLSVATGGYYYYELNKNITPS